MASFKNITGRQFGRLTAWWPSGKIGPRRAAQTVWCCACTCGELHQVRLGNLLSGRNNSCGCIRAEQIGHRSRTHGASVGRATTPEYNSYNAAKARCTNPNHLRFKDWGGRGIQFKFPSFEEFYKCLGDKPSPLHSVDRYPNNDGHYEPGNVRWATPIQQAQNKRRSAA